MRMKILYFGMRQVYKRHSLDFFSFAHAHLVALLSKFQWVMTSENFKSIAIQKQILNIEIL